MRSSIYMVSLLLLGCSIKPLEDYKTYPPTEDTMMLRQARYISSTPSQLVFEVDLYHAAGFDYGHFPYDYFLLSIDTTYFSFPNSGNFKCLTYGQKPGTSSLPSSSVILVDESGSWDSVDPFNSRTQGIIKLCNDLSVGEYMVGGFSKNGNLNTAPTEFIQSQFETYSDNQLRPIFNLATKTGGKSNLFDGVNDALDRFVNGTFSQKNIIVLAHNDDEISSISINAVITKAIAAQVQVHVLYLGDIAKTNNLAKLAGATGGSHITCSTIGELMTTLETLYETLNGTHLVYRVQMRYTPPTGTIASGNEFWFNIGIHDTLYDEDNNPIVAYVKVP